MGSPPRIKTLPNRVKMIEDRRPKEIGRIGATSRDRGRGRQAARLRIWLRDGPNCKGCGKLIDITPGTPDPFELDHKQALWLGGKDEDSNRQCLCIWCDESGRKRGCHAEKTAQEAALRASKRI